jgi:large subunit ribosomal protein L15
MKLHTLKPAEGSTKTNKRLGRGQGSGQGGTAGRGHKGAKSRSGYSRKPGFEGGQMPLVRRVPKFGFTPLNKITYKALNLDVLEDLAAKAKSTDLTLEVMIANGIINKKDRVKVLARGEVKSKVSVQAHAFSDGAVKAIEKVGGTVTTVK